MRELDVLLGRWLVERWAGANAQLQVEFESLLRCEDDQIWDWLMGRVEPVAELKGVVEDIRERTVRSEQA
ncbi:MAG: succinate dehydrogenase assembly factor 2 [Wenzhouxiangella sp.]